LRSLGEREAWKKTCRRALAMHDDRQSYYVQPLPDDSIATRRLSSKNKEPDTCDRQIVGTVSAHS